jgi:hypothetical protein
MDSQEIDQMRDRVLALEQANRRMLYAIAILGLVLVAFMGASTRFGRPSSRLRAEQFVLSDATGQTRATLSLIDGQPALTLLDDDGRQQVQLAARADRSAALDFRDGDQMRMVIASSSRGASVQMIDHENELSAALYSWSSGPSGLAFNRGLGGLRLAVEPDGGSQIGFADRKGQTRAGCEVSRRGSLRPLGLGLPGLSALEMGGGRGVSGDEGEAMSASAEAIGASGDPMAGTFAIPGGGLSAAFSGRPAMAP